LQPAYQTPRADALPPGDLTRWWRYFNDPVLDGLIGVSWQQNLDLRAAGFRIAQARALRGVVRGGLFPQTDAVGSYNYRRTSSNANQFVTRDSLSESFDLFSAGFDATWEIDIFGKIRRSLEAADADIGVQVEDYRDVLVTLLADVAFNYVTVRVLQEQLEIARANLAAQRQTLDLVRRRHEAGLVGRLDVAQAESNAHTTASTIPPLEEELQVALNRLSILLGQPPARDLAAWIGKGPLPADPGLLALGVPADLVRRRPDIRRAENEVAASSARIGVAVADLYPQLTIGGTITVDSRSFSSLFEPASLAHSVGPAFRWDVLNFGRVRNNIWLERARHNEALVNYQSAVLLAVEEVENGLVGYQRSLERVASLTSAAHAAREAVRLGRTQYDRGLINFQTLLDSERQRLQSEEQLAITRGAVLTSLIRTFKALGGGWEAPPPAVTSPGQADMPEQVPLPEASPVPRVPPAKRPDGSPPSQPRVREGHDLLPGLSELGQLLTRRAQLAQQ
jgi:NodT family efflux transporter outer membrane factor (OMF) lipoprotein